MQTDKDWLDKLADETGIGYGPLVAMIYAMLENDTSNDKREDWWAGEKFGICKGITIALRALDAKSETIVEAVRQVRRERG